MPLDQNPHQTVTLLVHFRRKMMIQLYLWIKIRTKWWLVLGACRFVSDCLIVPALYGITVKYVLMEQDDATCATSHITIYGVKLLMAVFLVEIVMLIARQKAAFWRCWLIFCGAPLKQIVIRTHIIGHYNPSVRITALLLTSLMLCVLIVYMSGGTHSLTSTPTDSCLEKLFMTGLFIFRVFARNLLRENRRRNISFIIFRFDVLYVWALRLISQHTIY